LQAGIRLSDGWSCAKEDMEASALRVDHVRTRWRRHRVAR
jgi:hypothetical protein